MIWLNSDRDRAQLLALGFGKETYSTKMRNSSIKLSRYYLKKTQIQEVVLEEMDISKIIKMKISYKQLKTFSKILIDEFVAIY